MLLRSDSLSAPLTLSEYEILVVMHDREWTGPHTIAVRRFGRASAGKAVPSIVLALRRMGGRGLVEKGHRRLWRLTDAGYEAWFHGPTDRSNGVTAGPAQPVW